MHAATLKACRLLSFLPLATASLSAAITWNVTFNDVVNGTGTGFDDAIYGADRQSTFMASLSYINSVIDANGSVDFVVQNSLNDGTSPTLASAGTLYPTGPGLFGFTNGLLYEHATTGTDFFPDNPDAVATFNFGHNWNSTLNTSQVNEFDLFTVSLHEISHAMGFSSLVSDAGVSKINGSNPGVYSIYDAYLGLDDGSALFDWTTGEFIGDTADLTSENVFFYGPNAVAANGGAAVDLYAPPTYSDGSSISHLNDPELVMYYSVAPGQEKRAYSSIELAILQDLGWELTQEGLAAVPESKTLYIPVLATLVLFWRRPKRNPPCAQNGARHKSIRS